MKRYLILWLGWSLRIAACGVALLAVLWWLIPACPLYRENLDWSTMLSDRQGKILHLSLADDDRYRVKTSLADISPVMVRATLAYEDEHYFSHPGINPLSMLRALAGHVQGIPRGGGSTLTMQYARLRFGMQTNTCGGKFQQMLRAIQLEKFYSKQEILEAYCNSAPYGGNVEGIAAASLRWCGKECRDLNTAEAVALVMLPQRPAARMPRPGTPIRDETLAARKRLLDKLSVNDSLLADYQWEAIKVPREVPHLARAFNDGRRTSLCIDVDLQTTIEEVLTDYLLRNAEKGVDNGGMLVLDAPSREVLAYVGSAGFFNNRIEGQIDAVKSRRSPGSLYKPFLFGLAIDQGLIHPNTLLADAPLRYSDYNPENNERDFLGPVMAGEALRRSRNIPALRLMGKLKDGGLYTYLLEAGVRMDHPAAHYGMSLTLGSAPASMEEIASLYCSLADDGISRPLRYRLDEKTPARDGKHLLSDAARWLLRDMLVDKDQDMPQILASENRLSYKTGTSQGFRDAWAVGISGDKVIVVWLGNFDNRSNPSLLGRKMAAPLLKDLFKRCGFMQKMPSPPAALRQVELCAVSGMMPSDYCQHRSKSWFIGGVSPIEPCDLHRRIWVNQRSGKRVAASDGDTDTKAVIMEFWSQEFLDLFRQAGMPRREIPSGDEILSTNLVAPRITSPLDGHLYEISEDRDSGLICKASVTPGARRLFWFGNGHFLSSTEPGEPCIWRQAEGSCKIQVMDDRGLSSAVTIHVDRK